MELTLLKVAVCLLAIALTLIAGIIIGSNLKKFEDEL